MVALGSDLENLFYVFRCTHKERLLFVCGCKWNSNCTNSTERFENILNVCSSRHAYIFIAAFRDDGAVLTWVCHKQPKEGGCTFEAPNGDSTRFM
ncbi:hypothetical protein AVEN_247433-1 [Araneus ventricosus]|uniref:Uncharacterized protein n=1 Tax=Araneus ventricosus TaxID=182803 RepID=A0A4Y2M0G8_ARAVE|nr:hypothetical protein AVEN_247433-1 [Araneus ventricosus]